MVARDGIEPPPAFSGPPSKQTERDCGVAFLLTEDTGGNGCRPYTSQHLEPRVHFPGFGFAASLRQPSETSNLRSISIQKSNCRCCVQRIRERMRDRRREPDSLI